jgi:hypothetical protein
MDTERDILMFYHTSLRNVALFTSLGLALQAYSSRIENKFKSIVIYFGYILFLLIAVYMNLLLISEIKSFNNTKQHVENAWIYVPYTTIIFLSIVFATSVPTFLNKFNFK